MGLDQACYPEFIDVYAHSYQPYSMHVLIEEELTGMCSQNGFGSIIDL